MKCLTDIPHREETKTGKYGVLLGCDANKEMNLRSYAVPSLNDRELEDLIFNGEPSDWLRALRYMFRNGIPSWGFREGPAVATSDVIAFLCTADRKAIDIAVKEINNGLDCPLDCSCYTPTSEYKQELKILDDAIQAFYAKYS